MAAPHRLPSLNALRAFEAVAQHLSFAKTAQDLHVTNTKGGRSSASYRAGVLVENKTGGTLRGIVVQRVAVDSVASNMSTDRSNPREWGGIVVISQARSGNRYAGVTIRDTSLPGLSPLTYGAWPSGTAGSTVENRNPGGAPDVLIA